MERKGSRAVQSSAKGPGPDSKKSQDVASGKLWPRGGRRREPSGGGGGFPAKTDPSRKPAPQKSRALDKRPRPRGVFCAGAISGKESTRIEEEQYDQPELGSVFVQGSKKQSLNHLLNFHYTPRETQQQTHANGGGRAGGAHHWLTTGKHKYNKEHFIQANCQFIVKSSGDYKQYMNNPDALVDWSLIEQVNVQVHELPSCPICLYTPTAAKMTRCGHIYCWSCVLHYLALSEKTYRKCPICYESVHRQDLKSVVPVPHSSFNVNETITFKLMRRARGSLIAYPAEEPKRDNETILYMSDRHASDVHCKLLLADKNDIVSIIEREKWELKQQLTEEGNNSSESCFIEEAINLLKDRENFILGDVEEGLNVNALAFVPSGGCINEAVKNLKICERDGMKEELRDGRRGRFESVSSEEFNENVKVDNANQQPMKYFYFYQAADGQHIYLHAVNVRMLEHTYGSLEFSPNTLTGRIVEKEGGSMTEELRNRLRYLQHLPVTCQFEVAEIHLGSPVVSKETVDYFGEQLEIRKKRRQRRSREEKRREKRIAEEENRQMGKYPVANIELESHQQFPDFGVDAMRERQLSESTTGSSPPISEIGSVPMENDHSGPSFAKMLTTATKQRSTWPELKAGGPSSAEPIRLINVTGSRIVPLRTKHHSESEPECEDYIPAPEYNRSFSDAIAVALEKAAKANDGENKGDGKGGSKKKKKNKQKVLFATSMAYCGK